MGVRVPGRPGLPQHDPAHALQLRGPLRRESRVLPLRQVELQARRVHRRAGAIRQHGLSDLPGRGLRHGRRAPHEHGDRLRGPGARRVQDLHDHEHPGGRVRGEPAARRVGGRGEAPPGRRRLRLRRQHRLRALLLHPRPQRPLPFLRRRGRLVPDHGPVRLHEPLADRELGGHTVRRVLELEHDPGADVPGPRHRAGRPLHARPHLLLRRLHLRLRPGRVLHIPDPEGIHRDGRRRSDIQREGEHPRDHRGRRRQPGRHAGEHHGGQRRGPPGGDGGGRAHGGHLAAGRGRGGDRVQGQDPRRRHGVLRDRQGVPARRRGHRPRDLHAVHAGHGDVDRKPARGARHLGDPQGVPGHQLGSHPPHTAPEGHEPSHGPGRVRAARQPQHGCDGVPARQLVHRHHEHEQRRHQRPLHRVRPAHRGASPDRAGPQAGAGQDPLLARGRRLARPRARAEAGLRDSRHLQPMGAGADGAGGARDIRVHHDARHQQVGALPALPRRRQQEDALPGPPDRRRGPGRQGRPRRRPRARLPQGQLARRRPDVLQGARRHRRLGRGPRRRAEGGRIPGPGRVRDQVPRPPAREGQVAVRRLGEAGGRGRGGPGPERVSDRRQLERRGAGGHGPRPGQPGHVLRRGAARHGRRALPAHPQQGLGAVALPRDAPGDRLQRRAGAGGADQPRLGHGGPGRRRLPRRVLARTERGRRREKGELEFRQEYAPARGSARAAGPQAVLNLRDVGQHAVQPQDVLHGRVLPVLHRARRGREGELLGDGGRLPAQAPLAERERCDAAREARAGGPGPLHGGPHVGGRPPPAGPGGEGQPLRGAAVLRRRGERRDQARLDAGEERRGAGGRAR
mmetsp:Transcript_98612/g.279481  ORF Transcript_98612/g.279481 Transcript_98612/m.279481 type:complete len:853 (-) Transcript_98612:121-2679(-)